MTCGPNRAKLSAHTRESTESSPPSWPCCPRQLRSGTCHPRIASRIAIPSASADSGPAIPSSDIDIATTTLVISGSSPGRAPRAPARSNVGAGRRISTPAGNLPSGRKLASAHPTAADHLPAAPSSSSLGGPPGSSSSGGPPGSSLCAIEGCGPGSAELRLRALPRCARGGTVEEHRALARVAGERGGALELGACLLAAAELSEEVAADARQQVVVAEFRLRRQRVDELEATGGPAGHGNGDRTVELHDGGRRERGQDLVERRDAFPVGLLRAARPGVAGGDRGLHHVGARRAAEPLGAQQRGEAPADEELIPRPAVLLQDRDRLPGWAEPPPP